MEDSKCESITKAQDRQAVPGSKEANEEDGVSIITTRQKPQVRISEIAFKVLANINDTKQHIQA